MLTLADWETLPEDELCRVEASEGILVVTPNPHPRHQNAVHELVATLRRQLPDSMVALPECDVLLSLDPLTVRAPDVLVVSAPAYASGVPRFAAGDLVLAVEIGSPGSARMDRVTKASEYADAGIPDYWIVDLTAGAALTCLRLDPAGHYEVTGEHRGRAMVEVDGARVMLDLDSLTG